MVKVVIIGKNGGVKDSTIKDLTEDSLYKKCGFRKPTDFTKQALWKFSQTENVSLYAKKKGRAGSENKYDLPPPIDSVLYFGNIVAVKHAGKKVSAESAKDFTSDEWKKLYEKLFGGFDDLTKTDEESSEEEIPQEFKTKSGYSKEDGFIVDDDEEDDDYVLDDGDEDDETELSGQSADECDDYEDDEGEEDEEDEDDTKIYQDCDDDDDDDDDDSEYSDSDDQCAYGSELSEEEY